jgi:hypothetical protein
MSYPDSLRDAIVAMLQTFVVTSDREVGGWPVPYILNRDGVFLVQFGYSVTDPIVDRLQDGDAIPLGTAEAGGVGFSLTEVGDGDGLVAYWLQKPGGYVFLRGVEGITQERFLGKPEEFVDKVYKKLGRRVDLMFGDRTVVNPDHRAALIDDNGNERIRIEGEGRNLVFRWKQGPPSSWQASASGIDLDGPSRRNERSP